MRKELFPCNTPPEHTMQVRSLLTVLTLTLGTAAFAQTPAPKDPIATPRVDQREANQEKRIEQGVASGQLAPRETQRLERREQRIEKAETHAKSDGVVTAKERRQLGNMQDHASRDIRREKHDPQRDMNHDGKRDRKVGGHQGGNKS